MAYKRGNVQDIVSAVSPAGPKFAQRNFFVRRDTWLRAEGSHFYNHFLNLVCRNPILIAVRLPNGACTLTAGKME